MAYGSVLTDVVQGSTSGTPPQFNDGNGTQIGTLCRAWVSYKGTATQAIRASFNVSSVTYNSTSLYTINFTNALSDANYSAVVTAQETSAGNRDGFYSIRGGGTYSTSAVQVSGGVLNAYYGSDNPIVNVAVFR